MEEKIRLAVFGQKRLSREGGILTASSFRRLFTLVKSPADFASNSNGILPDCAESGMIATSTGILTFSPCSPAT